MSSAFPSYLLHGDLTDKILKAFYRVYNTLGYGFLERVYENALLLKLRRMGLCRAAQQPVAVHYGREEVGKYFADFIVEDCIILELKAAEALIEEHELQLMNYLKATEIEVGLLLNFGKTPQFKCKVFSNP